MYLGILRHIDCLFVNEAEGLKCNSARYTRAHENVWSAFYLQLVAVRLCDVDIRSQFWMYFRVSLRQPSQKYRWDIWLKDLLIPRWPALGLSCHLRNTCSLSSSGTHIFHSVVRSLIWRFQLHLIQFSTLIGCFKYYILSISAYRGSVNRTKEGAGCCFSNK